MTNEIKFTDETPESANTLLNGLRRVLMASIGAVVLTQEQIEDFVGKLVERGEIAEGDARNLVSDVLERRKNLLQNGTKKADKELERRMQGFLERMNIPSKSEIESLSEKIGELSRKVDQLRLH